MTVCLLKNHVGALKGDYYIAASCNAGDTALPASIQTIAQALGQNIAEGATGNQGSASGTVGGSPQQSPVQPKDIPVVGPYLTAGSSLATNVSNFLGLITNTTVLKGVWLVIVAGVLLFVGVRFLKA